MSDPCSSTTVDFPNRLQGLTILRFAHAYDTGGGVELHLRDLNRGLSLRNAFTTILVRLGRIGEPESEQEEVIGASRLMVVPLRTTERAERLGQHEDPGARAFLREWIGCVVNFVVCTFSLNRLFARCLRRRAVPHRPLEALNAGSAVADLIKRYRVDLVVLHTNGGADASEVIAAAREATVPVVMIHHFSNDRLGNVSVRQQAAEVQAIAGASSVGLPMYLKERFTNLSDAVDLEFFRVENSQPVPVHFSTPVIFAPGRLTPEKGQMDALRVAIDLHRRGCRNTLVFAGRMDDGGFERALREKARDAGLSEFVHFAGELTLAQYRDWFRAAYLMLMPTHHHEGMPRTLIDAQAMQVPPLVYDIGGTRDGVRHGKTGYLVPLGDTVRMTAHAENLLRDAGLRDRMAAEGRAFVEAEFSMARFLQRHEAFYLQALSSSRRSERRDA